MHTRTRIGLSLAGAVACFVMLFSPAGQAGERTVNLRYAGTGVATSVDPNGDGVPVDVTDTVTQGTFGQSRLVITTEWMIHPRACPAGYDLPFKLVNLGLVVTMPDHSQLFGFSQEGWICANSTTGAYVGESYGIYNGGAGRFVGATGEWMTKFDGYNIDLPVSFRSIRGTVEGKVATP
ncbi:MAG: hypothetical protein EHM60_00385 [Lysobacterales bacterium]|jgi:hypothetical protein|nr:MAG: hypothetical protein EHM60_00385 [Xanthomonadales bacterium]